MSHTMTIAGLQAAYADGELTPASVMENIRQRAGEYAGHNIWIHVLSAQEQAGWLEALADRDPATHPLWGVPFAIKDNIDLAGIPTTAGCPEFAYTPSQSARVVQQLLDAGAIPVGKTNLDQFATGLNGTRSPYGACHNAFDPEYISGGSSSGSAVAVALGLASFSLGTDTAGSGRVPACFNNLVGVKPTRGLLSSRGLVPACRSLDCISLFALDTDDADRVLSCAEGFDQEDAFSRRNVFANSARHYGLRTGPLKMGVLGEEHLKFFGDSDYAAAYRHTLAALADAGVELVPVDYTPFDQAARLLYDGPGWRSVTSPVNPCSPRTPKPSIRWFGVSWHRVRRCKQRHCSRPSTGWRPCASSARRRWRASTACSHPRRDVCSVLPTCSPSRCCTTPNSAITPIS